MSARDDALKMQAFGRAQSQLGCRPHALLPWLCASAVLVCGLGSAVAAAPLAWRGWAYIGLHTALTLLMLGAWWSQQAVTPQHPTGSKGQPNMQAAQSLLWILTAGVLGRLLLVEVPAFTTHDVQRYVWDGAVVLSGLDPYRVAPDASVALPLRSIWPTPAEHAAYPTLYPPGALALFALSALAGPTGGVWLWKVLASAAGIATLLIGYRWLVWRGTPQHLSLLALSPLVLLETGVGAHVDAFSALAVVAALWAFESGKSAVAGLLIGLGALVKLLPLVLLLPLGVALLARRKNRDACALLLGAVATLAVGYGLALAMQLQPIGSLGLLFQRWRFGSPIFAALEAAVSSPLASSLALALLLVMMGVSAWQAWANKGRDVSAAVQLALAAPLLVSPVTFPWYLCVLLPALLLRPRFVLLAWMSVVPLSYEVLNAFDSTGVWSPATWPLWVTAITLSLGVLADALGLRLKDQTPPGPAGPTQDGAAQTLMTDQQVGLASPLQPCIAIIPAYNEAPAIECVVHQAKALTDRSGQPLFAEIIVVDNASNDATAALARRAGARVVHQPERGYGAACQAGIAAAPEAGCIVFIDGDASVDLTQTADLMSALHDGADLVIGARHELQPGAMSWPQRVGNVLASGLIRLLWQVKVSDLGPFRAMRGPALRRLGMRDRRFGWTVEMQVRAIQQGLNICEVPVRLLPRIGHSKISGTVKGVIGAAHGIFGTIAALWLAQQRGGY